MKIDAPLFCAGIVQYSDGTQYAAIRYEYEGEIT